MKLLSRRERRVHVFGCHIIAADDLTLVAKPTSQKW